MSGTGSALIDKKKCLEEDKFQHEKDLVVVAKADAEARWKRERDRDDKQLAFEQARMTAESQHNADKLKLKKDKVSIRKIATTPRSSRPTPIAMRTLTSSPCSASRTGPRKPCRRPTPLLPRVQ